MYRLTPPTTSFRAGTDSLWRRVSNDIGLAIVLYDDGRVTTKQVAPASCADGVDTVWPGGRTYDISDEHADLLIAAGYSSCLEVV